MATVRVRYTLHVVDDDGNKANITAYVETADTQTIAQLQTDADTFATLVDPITGSVITEVTAAIVTPFVSGIPKTEPVEGTENADTCVISYDVPVTGRVWGFAIAGLNDAFREGGKVVDVGGAIGALKGAMGAGPGTYTYTSNNWDVLGAPDHTFLTNRKRGHLVRTSRTAG